MSAEWQINIFLHLLLFFFSQRRKTFSPIPELRVKICGGELPLAALFGYGGRRFQRKQRNGLFNSPFTQIQPTQQLRD